MLKFKNMSLLILAVFCGLCGITILLQTGCSIINRSDSTLEEKAHTYHPGKFVWHELMTSDVAASKLFYGQLFNWTFEERDQYTLIKLDNKRIGGIIQSPENMDTRWISSISVPDVDQATDIVIANGGKVHKGPENTDDLGRAALVSDPQGAQFSLIHTKNGDTNDGPVVEGAWLWHELLTNNPKDSAVFYEALAGYSTIKELDDYWILKTDTKWHAGIRRLLNKTLKQRWVPVIKVLNVREISPLAKQLGGKVIIEPDNPDFVDQVALLADTSGALFIIQEWPETDDSKGEKKQ